LIVLRRRAEQAVSGATLKSAAAAGVNGQAMANPFEFMQQVRAETTKVVWPTRKETIVTTIMVLIMATIAALFFLAADQVLSWAVSMLLQIGR